MKRYAMILALLALVSVPAFAGSAPVPAMGETAPAPALAWMSAAPAPAQACPAPTPTLMANGLFAQPVMWSEDLIDVFKPAAGCAQYCRLCDGCCAILGPGSCACC